MSVISSACSPVSGCDTSKSLTLTPSFSAYTGSSACSASTNAAVPPWLCAEAMMASVSVVLPEDSGSEDFDDAAARNAADAERDIKTQRTGGDRIHLVGGAGIAQAHDRTFAKLFFDLAQRGCESFLAILFHGESSTKCGAIISYSAPQRSSHMHRNRRDFLSEFAVSSSSGQVSTTV